uniref:Uncharacterized protein n=1 Tax=Rhizophora mucronata TaxID=61149 RepID=A0A2P2NWP4_RHIMU
MMTLLIGTKHDVEMSF